MSVNKLKRCGNCDYVKHIDHFPSAGASECWDCMKSSVGSGGASVANDPGQHYRYEYKGVKLDPFRIAMVYGITDFGQQTILKKALRMGTAHKDRQQDLKDIICAAERMLEMMNEDES